MDIQLIEKQRGMFRLLIDGTPCTFLPLDLFVQNNLLPQPRVMKGSMLGWHVKGRFVSYRKIKQAITSPAKIHNMNEQYQYRASDDTIAPCAKTEKPSAWPYMGENSDGTFRWLYGGERDYRKAITTYQADQDRVEAGRVKAPADHSWQDGQVVVEGKDFKKQEHQTRTVAVLLQPSQPEAGEVSAQITADNNVTEETKDALVQLAESGIIYSIIQKHLFFQGGTDDKWFLQASLAAYTKSGKISGSLYTAIDSAMQEYADTITRKNSTP